MRTEIISCDNCGNKDKPSTFEYYDFREVYVVEGKYDNTFDACSDKCEQQIREDWVKEWSE